MSAVDAGTVKKNTRGATSCTACRQAKLRCDLKERHPSACTRCIQNGLQCSTDASFKRVSTRRKVPDIICILRVDGASYLTVSSRIKDLESEVAQLQNRRPTSQTSFQIPLDTPPSSNRALYVKIPSGRMFTSQSSASPEKAPCGSPMYEPTQWLVLTEPSMQSHFELDDCVFSYADVQELFQHFEEYYYPFFCILEPVTCLSKLAQDSQLLFWTIIVIAARHHTRHHVRFVQIKEAHSQLYSKACHEAVQNVLDLQAVLMMCAWPYPLAGQFRDPTWMRLGMAISAARQIGLSNVNAKDEVFFGTRRAKYQLSKHPPHIRKLTWLKCFEMDVQNSLWYGHLPTLATPHHLRSVVSFCQDELVPIQYAISIRIHIQTARYLMSVEDRLSYPPSSSMIRSHRDALDAVKSDNASTWTPQNELVLRVAKMYLFATYLAISVEEQADALRPQHHYSSFDGEVLEAARTCATQFVDTLILLVSEAQARRSSYLEQSYPMPGFPKIYSRIAFFAATVQLHFLDGGQDRTSESTLSAQDSFERVYHLLSSCPTSHEHMQAAKTLEVAGRAIGHGGKQLEPTVTTRMAASLMYCVTWLGGLARGRSKDPEFNTEANAATSSCSEEMSQCSNDFDKRHSCQISDPNDVGAGFEFSSMNFPFGIWDDAIYDQWLSYGVDGTMEDANTAFASDMLQ